MNLILKQGATDVRLLIFIQSSSTFAGRTGLTFESVDLRCYYARPGSAPVQVPLVAQTVTGAHVDGGFVELSATNLAGLYRLDVPDAVCAAGVNFVEIMLSRASNMFMMPFTIELAAFDLNVVTTEQIADAVYEVEQADHKEVGSFGRLLNEVGAATAPHRKVADKSTGDIVVYDTDKVTPVFTTTIQVGPTDAKMEVVRSA